MKLRVGIVDDNSFLINNIKEKLSFFDNVEVRLSAFNGKEIIEKLNKSAAVDIILMDIEMPVMNGIEATEIIKQKFPQIKIVMLTTFDNDELILDSIKAGADGYLLKETKAKKLHDYLFETIQGGAAMTPSIALKTLKLLRNPIVFKPDTTIDFSLSQREIEVLEQLSTGLSYKKIAENLFISPNTVRKHFNNIYKKLQVSNKVEAIQKAKKHNIL